MAAGQSIWPKHAYVPGLTPRHPEGFFDPIRLTAHAGLSPFELEQSDAFRLGMRLLDAGFFWEAHELLEPVWLALPEGCNERKLVQALIQIANGYLKLRMARLKAAGRLAAIASAHIRHIEADRIMGIRLCRVRRRIALLAST